MFSIMKICDNLNTGSVCECENNQGEPIFAKGPGAYLCASFVRARAFTYTQYGKQKEFRLRSRVTVKKMRKLCRRDHLQSEEKVSKIPDISPNACNPFRLFFFSSILPVVRNFVCNEFNIQLVWLDIIFHCK